MYVEPGDGKSTRNRAVFKYLPAMSKTRRRLRLTREHSQNGVKMKGQTEMKYILMMNTMTAGDIYAGVSGWQQNDIQRHTAFLKDLSKSLRESGELISTEGLALPDQAR